MSGEQSISADSSMPTEVASLTLDALAAFLEISPDALIVVDSAGTIVRANQQMEFLFGYAQEELPGLVVDDLLPEQLRAIHAVRWGQYMRVPRARPMGLGLDLVGLRKDGSSFPVDISLRPILIEHTLYIMAAIRDISAQRQAERERIATLERSRLQDKLISLAHDAILVRDPDGRILCWNEGATHLYGWTAQEAKGQVLCTLLQTCFPASFAEFKQALDKDGKWEGELIHTCRDGRRVIVESRHVMTRNEQGEPTAILEINRDVTERRRLEQVEQEIHAEREAQLGVLQLILDRLPSGIFLVQGPQFRLLMSNRAMTTLLQKEWRRGMTREEFRRYSGVSLFTIDGKPLADADAPTAIAMMSGKPVLHAQMVIRRSDGTHLPILMDAIPFDGLHDLSRLPHEIAEILASEERVVMAVHNDATALQEAEALKDQFVSLATHELRTPITIIAGYADRLLMHSERGTHQLDKWQQEKVQAMKRAAWQLANLTGDLLDVTRMQAGQFRLELTSVDLVALTQQVVKRLQVTTEHHQIVFHTTLPQLRAMVDTFRFEQVLSNLLSNAIKYSPDGGSIDVTLEEHMEPHEAKFSIRDQGIGIPRDQQARLFGRFARADNARVMGIPGTGLGLYLCRELVERHGGSICFESEEGAGSTFRVSLPCNGSALSEGP